MPSLKEIKQAEKSAVQQRELIRQLNELVDDIARCERTITGLKSELDGVNVKHQGRRTTRDDINYLTDLLRCANKKLAWEKQMASVQKRTPEILDKMSKLLNDAQNPPPDEIRKQMLESLQGVQGAMERLQNVKVN